MANFFKSYRGRNITTQTTIFTGPTSTQTTIIGLSVANTSVSTTSVSAILNDGTNSFYLIKGASVPVGGSLVIIGGEQKVVVEPTHTIQIVATQTVDAIMSTMEIS